MLSQLQIGSIKEAVRHPSPCQDLQKVVVCQEPETGTSSTSPSEGCQKDSDCDACLHIVNLVCMHRSVLCRMVISMGSHRTQAV